MAVDFEVQPGSIAGAYSSLFIASPLLAVLKEREPRYRDIKARLAGRQGPVVDPILAPATDGDAAASAAGRPTGPAPTLSGRPIPPRPRKKGKKR